MVDDILREVAIVDGEIRSFSLEKMRIDGIIQSLLQKKEELNKLHNKKLAEQLFKWRSWGIADFGWRSRVQEILERDFGFDEFRPFQLATLNTTLAKQHAILITPTGKGKSLCYQLPALKDTGITLVICPTLSLIEDQMYKAKKLQLPAFKVTPEEGTFVRASIKKQLNNEDESTLRLLFITADILVKNQKLMAMLRTCYSQSRIKRIVVDEIHCCSEKGHDYRTDYRLLPLLRRFFYDVPIIALTATARVPVINDSQRILDISTGTIIKVPFEKQNVFYRMVHKPYTFSKCMGMIRTFITRKYRHLPGIIYADTVKECENVTKGLRAIGLRAQVYSNETELDGSIKVYEKWMKNAFQIMVATLEFAVGIDNPDVRYVIHFSTPKSVEEIYQQGGRGDRDGSPAVCVTFFKLIDYFKYHTSANSEIEDKRNADLLEFTLNRRECRHVLLARQFEEITTDCKNNCDNCKSEDTVELCSLSRPCIELYEIIRDATAKKRNLTITKLVFAWYRVCGLEIVREDAEIIITHLIHCRALTAEKVKTAFALNYYVRRCFEVPPESGLDVYLKQSPPLKKYLSEPPVVCEISRFFQEMTAEPKLKKRKFNINDPSGSDEIIELSD